jgi:hypothetical protein
MTNKADLHRLIESLPETLTDEAAYRLEELQNPEHLAEALKRRLTFDQLCELVAWLQQGLDPLERRLLTAAFDDEPVGAAEQAAIADAYEDLAASRTVSGAEVRREFGR